MNSQESSHQIESDNSWKINEWFSDLSDDQKNKMKIYKDELLRFNQVINLISRKTEKNIDLVHFADCIIGAKNVLNKIKNDVIYDFGSGNGFPGVIFSILNNKTKIYLVESDSRKVEFLNYITKKLSLINVQVINTRVETLPLKSVDVAICRGFMSLQNALVVSRKVISKGGEFYLFKGDQWGREIAALQSSIYSIWSTDLFVEYLLPESKISFAIILCVKMK